MGLRMSRSIPPPNSASDKLARSELNSQNRRVSRWVWPPVSGNAVGPTVDSTVGAGQSVTMECSAGSDSPASLNAVT